MSALRTRGLIGAALVVVVLGTTAACGNEDTTAPPAAQPTESPTTPTPSPTPSGTPSTDCPDPLAKIRAVIDKAVWGKGAAKVQLQPVSVTICQYDAKASGQDYATVSTKRTGQQATNLFTLVNSPKPVAKKPTYCTQELGPTYVLRFAESDGDMLSYAAEAYGCRRLVAISKDGESMPSELPAPRQVTPELIKSLGLR